MCLCVCLHVCPCAELLDEVLKNLNTDPVFADVVAASPAATEEALAVHFATNPSGTLASSAAALQSSNVSADPSNSTLQGAGAARSVSLPAGGVTTSSPHQHQHQQQQQRYPTAAGSEGPGRFAQAGFQSSPPAACVNPETATSVSMRVVYNAAYDYSQLRGNNSQPHALQRLAPPNQATNLANAVTLPSAITATPVAVGAASTGLPANSLAVHTTLLSQPWEPDAAAPVDFNIPLQFPSMPGVAHGHNPSAHSLYTHGKRDFSKSYNLS